MIYKPAELKGKPGPPHTSSARRTFVYTPPVLLDLELAVRFLRRRVGPLLRGTALAALIGICLASMALVVTLALMEGYTQAIGGRLTLSEADGIASRLAGATGVTRTAAVTYLAALAEDATDPASPLPVVVKAVVSPPRYLELGSWPEQGMIPAAVGAGLARALNLTPGSELLVQIPPAAGSWVFPILRLEVVTIFTLSFTEFDDRWVVVPLERVLEAVPDTLATELVFTDWREMNRPMFAALRWQTLSLFVVLTLVVAVASFQISSALVVLAIDKRRTAGMLKARGATPLRVWRVLVFAGVLLGCLGVACGLICGTAISVLLTMTKAVRFPDHLAQVYLVDHVPFIVTPGHLASVAAVCFTLVVVASAWPALATARQNPAAALRAV